MKSVVFRGAYDVQVEDRPKPVLIYDNDAIVKVETAGLCGSELHMYRGHQATETGHIMGHEFIGIIESVGDQVTKFKVGDRVISIFATVCEKCWYCQHGMGNRCVESQTFGTQQLDGGQAEFVRVPFADGTLHLAPTRIDDSLLVMMCDIFPTGYYGAMRAVAFLQRPLLPKRTNDDVETQTLEQAVFVCLGCGPVGLCALLTAKSKGVGTVYAVDTVDERLEQAKAMGAVAVKLGVEDIAKVVSDATNGRGADAVVEVVGNKAALRSAFDLVRNCGIVSSLGFHQGGLPFTGLESYTKNLTINFGRAPLSAVFDEALECLEQNRDHVSTIVSHTLPLSEANHGYDIFEKYQARKVVFKL